MTSRILVGAGLVLMSASELPARAEQRERCANCSAEVVLADQKAEDFTKVLMILSSMPLSGEIVKRNAGTKTATVLVSTDPIYAKRNGLDSFDVAKRVVGFVKDYGIREIRAVFRVKAAQP
jgi:hypothetical protein